MLAKRQVVAPGCGAALAECANAEVMERCIISKVPYVAPCSGSMQPGLCWCLESSRIDSWNNLSVSPQSFGQGIGLTQTAFYVCTSWRNSAVYCESESGESSSVGIKCCNGGIAAMSSSRHNGQIKVEYAVTERLIETHLLQTSRPSILARQSCW